MNIVKGIIREIFISLHLDLTKNLKYDRLTREIFRKYIKKDFNCIDVGCHKGEILDMMLKYSPEGRHYAFEPIPYMFNELQNRYRRKAQIFPYALSDRSGEGTFQLVKNAPAYSGIKRRRYDFANLEVEEIKVELKTLDEAIPLNEKIHIIKIDVEGGEFDVMKGGKKLLKSNRPMVIFEYGQGASEYYGTKTIDLYNFITKEIGLEIYTLQSFIKNKQSVTATEFENYFISNREYYFIAAKSGTGQ